MGGDLNKFQAYLLHFQDFLATWLGQPGCWSLWFSRVFCQLWW